MSIREDLLNNYAEQMVNYCTTDTIKSLHDTLASSATLVNEKDTKILQFHKILDSLSMELSIYMEKKRADDISHRKRLALENFKYRKYCTLFWLMVVLYLARIIVPTVESCIFFTGRRE